MTVVHRLFLFGPMLGFLVMAAIVPFDGLEECASVVSVLFGGLFVVYNAGLISRSDPRAVDRNSSLLRAVLAVALTLSFIWMLVL